MNPTLTLLAILVATCTLHGAQPPAKHLLLDDRVIAYTDNAQLTIGAVKKHPANPLFGEDKPWEKRFDNLYANVIHDETDGS